MRNGQDNLFVQNQLASQTNSPPTKNLNIAVTNINKSEVPLHSPINIDKLEYALNVTDYDPIKRAQVISGFRTGFDLGYRGLPNSKTAIQNHKSCKDHPEVVNSYLDKEISTGRISGPFADPPL